MPYIMINSEYMIKRHSFEFRCGQQSLFVSEFLFDIYIYIYMLGLRLYL